MTSKTTRLRRQAARGKKKEAIARGAAELKAPGDDIDAMSTQADEHLVDFESQEDKEKEITIMETEVKTLKRLFGLSL